jgi:hypothetical protein
MPAFQNGERPPKRKVFQQEISAGAKLSHKENNQVPRQAQHETSLTRE